MYWGATGLVKQCSTLWWYMLQLRMKSPFHASNQSFIDWSQLGEQCGQHYASCLHFHRVFSLVPMLGWANQGAKIALLIPVPCCGIKHTTSSWCLSIDGCAGQLCYQDSQLRINSGSTSGGGYVVPYLRQFNHISPHLAPNSHFWLLASAIMRQLSHPGQRSPHDRLNQVRVADWSEQPPHK